MRVTDKQPLVSIIVPVYNAEKYIKECLDSILGQSYTYLEILLIDDGSKDNSGQICDRYVEIDNRIKVFHRTNSGVSKTRNFGLDNCHGEWVAFVDSDDYIEKDYIERFLKQNLSHFSVGGYNLFGGHIKGIEAHCSDINHVVDLEIQSDIIDVSPKQIEINVIYHICGKIYSNKKLQEYHIRFPEDLKLAEDCCFNIEYLMHCNHVDIVPYAGYYYRKSHHAPVYKMDIYQFKTHVDILNKYFERYSQVHHYEFHRLPTAIKSSYITALKDGMIGELTFTKLMEESRYNRKNLIINEKLLKAAPGYLGRSISFIYTYPLIGWLIIVLQRMRVSIR